MSLIMSMDDMGKLKRWTWLDFVGWALILTGLGELGAVGGLLVCLGYVLAFWVAPVMALEDGELLNADDENDDVSYTSCRGA